MKSQAVTNREAFSLVELMVTLIMATIVMSGIAAALVESQKGWNWIYNRAYGDMTSDAYVARKAFEAVVRKSSTERDLISNDNSEVTVHYYNAETSLWLDRYARFHVNQSQGKLMVDYGELDGYGNQTALLHTAAVARNVVSAKFGINGACVQMIARLDNGSTAITVVASAVRHNE